jgi:hypothetical protein
MMPEQAWVVHPDALWPKKSLWMDDSPFRVAGGFITRKQNEELAWFLDPSICLSTGTGVLRELQKKWNAFGILGEYAFPSMKKQPSKR